MTLTIQQLRQKWNTEKVAYRECEVGSGTQKFVKNMLMAEQLFAIKEGLLTTPLEWREYEFVEEPSKKGRHADVVIYSFSDTVIPVEIERYGNIKASVKQVLQYQADWDKKYGILTDGFEWRFYNNNIYRSFFLNDILDEPETFLTFWREYLKPENYYLSLFEEQNQLSLFKELTHLPVDSNREVFFDDITHLIKSLRLKLKLEGYFLQYEGKKLEKATVEITYAYIIQFILYKTLVDNDFAEFKSEYDEMLKTIHHCLRAEQYGKILGIIEGIAALVSHDIYHPFAAEQRYISEKLLVLIRQPKNELHEVSPWLDIFVFIRKYDFGNVRNEIFGYIYENYLKELYDDANKGQYFTDPAIVNYMLSQVGWTQSEIRKRLKTKSDTVSIADPSCGSGTFLYSAVREIVGAIPGTAKCDSLAIQSIVNRDVFGLDIAEFPLYLAEMNILMRMLPLIVNEKYNNPVDRKLKLFLTKDSLSEFVDTALVGKAHTARNQQELFPDIQLSYGSYVRDPGDLEEMKLSLESSPQCPRRRFDFVIGNPPYVGYNECCKQKLLYFDLLKEQIVKLNNVYGVNLHSIPGHTKKHRPNPNLYAFFIALGLALLKDNGKLCYIVPQTLLTAGDLDVLRYHLASSTIIDKLIVFNSHMFIDRGIKQKKVIPTSSLIVVASRNLPSVKHKVEVIAYKGSSETTEGVIEDISKGKKINRQFILQSELLENAANWNYLTKDARYREFYEAYWEQTDDIVCYYDHKLARHTLGSTFYFDSGYSIDEQQILSKKPSGEYYSYPKLKRGWWTITESRGYWPNIRSGDSIHTIKLRQANQGYTLLDSKYKVLWSYANPNRFHFTGERLIWARNQYCAIGSDDKDEILYLCALMNSSVVTAILHGNLRNKEEKDLLVSTTAVKDFMRVPRITSANEHVKKQIIKSMSQLITLEDVKLRELVDFSNVLIQKFTAARVTGKYLVLSRNNTEVRARIMAREDLVSKIIVNIFGNEQEMFSKEDISLSFLKNTPVVDADKAAGLFKQIDELVFALYFDIELPKSVVNHAVPVMKSCAKNEYFEYVMLLQK